LEYMPSGVVSFVEPLCVNAVKITHTGGKIRLGGFYNQMVMIIHEAIGVANPMICFDDGCQSL